MHKLLLDRNKKYIGMRESISKESWHFLAGLMRELGKKEIVFLIFLEFVERSLNAR